MLQELNDAQIIGVLNCFRNDRFVVVSCVITFIYDLKFVYVWIDNKR